MGGPGLILRTQLGGCSGLCGNGDPVQLSGVLLSYPYATMWANDRIFWSIFPSQGAMASRTLLSPPHC